MHVIHTSTGFTAPLTMNSNLLEPNLYTGLIMLAVVVATLLLGRLSMNSLLNSPGVPVRVKSSDRRR